MSNVEVGGDLPDSGRQTTHQPEILLNNFSTRLGRRVGRFLGSLFYAKPAFRGRQAVTFHNQRDYIFVRHHRYIFEERDDKKAKKVIARPPRRAGTWFFRRGRGGDVERRRAPTRRRDRRDRAGLQELGPRFTLKLRWLQDGTFDTKFGAYEWLHRRKQMDTSRRKFHL